MSATGDPPPLFSRSTWREAKYVAEALRAETVGGGLLLGAAIIAIIWANSPWGDAYFDLRELTVGPASIHLDLSLGTWAADGLLAIFFLVAGLELKREFAEGDLADRRKAVVPIVAAVSGVVFPALLYVLVSTVILGGDGDVVRGWAVPTATDIAFALAVLAVIGSHLPSALRAFLLTLAVVDDLIAITIIALFYTEAVNLLWLAAAVVPLAVFVVLLRRGITHPAFLALPAILTWVCVHESGVHATVAGVLLGLAVPVRRRTVTLDSGPTIDDVPSLAERMEHELRPFSAGIAVPVFAFFAAGVYLGGDGFRAALSDPAAAGIVVGLVVGKGFGVLLGTYLIARFTKAAIDPDLSWSDIAGVSLLAGVGFTVSLLISELAFGAGSERGDHARVAVVGGSLLAAALSAVVLRRRNAHYRELEERDARDDDGDGVPDAYQRH